MSKLTFRRTPGNSQGRFKTLCFLYTHQKGLCCYCKQKCKLGTGGQRFRMDKDNDPLMATIEHLYPRTDIRSGALYGNQAAMACMKCNQEKSREYDKLVKRPYEYKIPYGIDFPNLLIATYLGKAPLVDNLTS